MSDDESRLQRSCSLAGSLVNPEGPWLFVLIGLLGVTVVVPTVVVSANATLTHGLVTGAALVVAWVVVAALLRVPARRAVERERAWVASLPFQVERSYWNLLQEKPHVYYTQGTEGTVEVSTICRYLRVHVHLPPDAVSALVERLEKRVPRSATVASDPGGQVAVTKKVGCGEHARRGREWIHDLIEGGLMGFDRVAEISSLDVSWSRTSYLVKRDLNSAAKLVDDD